ncbi:DoxX family protein [Paenibacillus illinoisensis]|uniref:DoxX family protein n=1 Tax=Paenibacillus illinoisensis TaxID=59845 RepID=A0A2W0CAY6_9BACL|nr:DoxX family protein [Paenibacillus illinoisensis]PYY29337.1 DoxX family protein [Paenibacillus illinoisensis]
MRVIGYIFLVVLAGVFVMTGLNEVMGAEMMVQTFESFSYPKWTMYLLGAVELLSAVGLLIPRTRMVAAGVLTFILIGALGSHLIYGQYGAVALPAILLVANIVVLAIGMRKLEEEEVLEVIQA